MEQLLDIWNCHDSYLILGEEKIGKTTLLKNCIEKMDLDTFHPVFLTGHRDYQNAYAPFQLSITDLGSNKLFAKQVGEKTFEGISKETNIPFKALIDTLVNYNEIQQNNRLLTLCETEKKIISQLRTVVKKKKLVLIADNYHMWDDKSCGLLSFLMTDQAKSILPFLNGARYVIASTSKPLGLDFAHVIMLEPYATCASFTLQLRQYTLDQEEDFCEQLYAITGGNLGKALELSEILMLHKYRFSEKLTLSNSVKDVLYRTLRERLTNTSKQHTRLIPTMESAAILGEQFETISLQRFQNVPYYDIIECLSVADRLRLIRKCMLMQDGYEFYNEFIFQFFSEIPDNRKRGYHHSFAMMFEKFRQFDYYKRFYHLYHAGMLERSYEMLSIHLIRQRVKYIPVADVHIDLLKSEGGKYYDSFEAICQALDAPQYRDSEKHLMIIDASFGFLTLLERDYAYAILVTNNGVSSEYVKCYNLLNQHFNELGDEYFEQRIRFGLLLLTFCVNRVTNHQRAREVERRLTFELAHKVSDDTHWERLSHILNRNSGSIYSTEIALIKVKRSYEFFSAHKKEYADDFFMAATNYVGLLIVASEYKKAYENSTIYINDLKDLNVYVDRIDKLINNYVLSAYLSNEITAKEALEIYDTAFGIEDLSDKPLVLNNYHLLTMYNGKAEKALRFFEAQFSNSAINNHNDYYPYLFGVNYLSLLIVLQQYDAAVRVFAKIGRGIPCIMEGESTALSDRYQVFERIINERFHFSSVEEFVNVFRSYCANSSLYYSNPFIFTDQQFWTTV